MFHVPGKHFCEWCYPATVTRSMEVEARSYREMPEDVDSFDGKLPSQTNHLKIVFKIKISRVFPDSCFSGPVVISGPAVLAALKGLSKSVQVLFKSIEAVRVLLR